MPLNAAELLVSLDGRGAAPLRSRLAAALRDAIRRGQLAPGSLLPSTRVLSGDLGVSRGVVVDAYAQLASEGFLRSTPGAGTTVAFLPQSALPEHWRGQRPPVRVPPPLDLRPGWPDLSAFPRREWAKATKAVLGYLPSSELGYLEPWGAWELRAQLADYLARVRGAMATPDGIVVVTGVTQGLALLCRILVREGHDTLAVEDPSNAIQRKLLGRSGIRLVDVPVDEHGLRVEALAATGARAVLCTPAHQYPTGVTLSAERREQLLRWADDVGGLIFEDDYDAEFRYERSALACLQAMSPTHVALLGSMSKSLAPALRIGWVVTPPQLLPALRRAKCADDFGSNSLDQHILSRLLESGVYDRQVRMVRRRYRQRREALVSALSRRLPEWTVLGSAGGLHLTVVLPPEVSERRVIAAAAERGLAVLGLEPMNGATAERGGLVISFARATPDMVEDAVDRLVAALAACKDNATEEHDRDDPFGSPWDDLG